MSGTPLTAGGSVYPQGVELAQIAQQVAGEAAQVFPGLVSGLLWSHPQVRLQNMQSAGSGPQGYGLQSGGFGWSGFYPQEAQFGFTRQQAFDPGMQTPGFGQQGKIGQVAQQVAWAAAQALPGLISGLLSSHLQLRQQTAQSGGISAEGYQGYRVPSSPFYGFNATGFNATQQPHLGQLVQRAMAQQLHQPTTQFGGAFPQSYGTQAGFGYGFNPQQQDIPQLVQQAVALQLRQQTSQFGDLSPQGFGAQGAFGWYGVNPLQQNLAQLIQQAVAQQLFHQTTRFGGPSLQGFGSNSGFNGSSWQQPEVAQLAQQISGMVAQQIPGIVHAAMSTVVGARL